MVVNQQWGYDKISKTLHTLCGKFASHVLVKEFRKSFITNCQRDSWFWNMRVVGQCAICWCARTKWMSANTSSITVFKWRKTLIDWYLPNMLPSEIGLNCSDFLCWCCWQYIWITMLLCSSNLFPCVYFWHILTFFVYVSYLLLLALQFSKTCENVKL